jgi:hypothetical protein
LISVRRGESTIFSEEPCLPDLIQDYDSKPLRENR